MIIVVTAGLLLVANVSAKAEEGATVQDIIVQGNERIESDTVRSYMSVAVGDRLDPSAIEKSLKALFATGLFADVTVHQEGNTIVVHVVENPIINRVAYEGLHRVKQEDLDKEVKLKARSVFTRNAVQADEKRILDIYRREGKFGATVEPKIIELPQNRVDLVFEISEGPSTYVEKIAFIGNNSFSDDDLKQTIETKETRWWRFLSSSDTYDPDRMDYDREKLRRFYLSNGYADFRVVSAVAELSPNRENFYMTFTVDEGDRYKMGKIDVKSAIAEIDPAAAFEQIEDLHTDDWYNADQIEKVVQKLTDFAGDKGYAFVDVRPVLVRNHDTRVIDVTFEIHEAPRVFVERIDIVGNERTLDKVIRREMRLVEGDAFNTAKLRLSKDRIKDLDFFDKSDVTNVPSDTAPDRTVIKVDVSEKSTGELTFGIGYSTAYGAMINVGAGERNLLGTAQQISISGEFALLQAGGKISYTDPYFLDKRLAAGFDIFAQNTSVYESYAYATGTTGFDIRAGWMYNEHWRHDITYTASMTNVHDVQPGVSLYILDQQGVNTLSSIGHILTYDRRDSHTETKSGWYVYFGNDVAGLLGTEHFVRNSLGAGKYYTFADEWTLSLIASAGYMNPWGGHQVHINNLFFLGGNTMPGFSYGGISPRDRGTEDALGGVWDAVGNASLKLPLGLPKEYGVGARLFTYVGSIGGTIDPGKYGPVDQSSVPRVSSGIGVVWKSPMGPVDFDLAVPIVRQSYDKIRFFFFNFGQHF